MNKTPKTTEEAVNLRKYARERTLTTYQKLMATPRATPDTVCAWRENGEIRFWHTPPQGKVCGSAEGQSLFTPLFAYIDGWRPEDFLTDEQIGNVRRAVAEIKLRNNREQRTLKAQAIADLLRKEGDVSEIEH